MAVVGLNADWREASGLVGEELVDFKPRIGKTEWLRSGGRLRMEELGCIRHAVQVACGGLAAVPAGFGRVELFGWPPSGR